MGARRPPPAERVRARLAAVAGDAVARTMPPGYQRLGRVLAVRLPEALRPFFPLLGAAWQQELGVATVIVRTGPIAGELRRPTTERIAGGPTVTEVVEHGIVWELDAAEIMFAAGNRTERVRAGRLARDGETVVDLFAGIGYFAVPAARAGLRTRVLAVEKNPVAVGFLRRNVVRNGVADRVTVVPGDNRTVALPLGAADRIFLGYLPSAIPWVPRALALGRPDGAWLHLHTVVGTDDGVARALDDVEAAVRAAGGELRARPVGREVKPYGPGRTHVVVDAHVGRDR